MNAVYENLTPAGRAFIWKHCAKLFRGTATPVAASYWHAEFAGRRVLLPIRSDWMWLDWDLALSFAGNQIAITETYAALLASTSPPTFFVDVGANYGGHSLPFLVSGVPVIAFEPNPACHEYFNQCCAANGVAAELEPVALGDHEDIVDFMYPETETWYGSADPETIAKRGDTAGVVHLRVAMRQLDDYREKFQGQRLLVKIDTEGNELSVLRGAISTLNEQRPMLIFESWPDEPEKRVPLYDFLHERAYRICGLPFKADRSTVPLFRDPFLAASGWDFIALPVEDERLA